MKYIYFQNSSNLFTYSGVYGGSVCNSLLKTDNISAILAYIRALPDYCDHSAMQTLLDLQVLWCKFKVACNFRYFEKQNFEGLTSPFPQPTTTLMDNLGCVWDRSGQKVLGGRWWVCVNLFLCNFQFFSKKIFVRLYLTKIQSILVSCLLCARLDHLLVFIV